jgi:hypothetical protein
MLSLTKAAALRFVCLCLCMTIQVVMMTLFYWLWKSLCWNKTDNATCFKKCNLIQICYEHSKLGLNALYNLTFDHNIFREMFLWKPSHASAEKRFLCIWQLTLIGWDVCQFWNTMFCVNLARFYPKTHF